MPRKKETITLSIPAGVKEKPEAIAASHKIMWGSSPSVSGLIVAIALKESPITEQKIRSKTMIDYYILDKIESENDGTTWGYLGEKIIEVFDFDETEDELIKKGFVKCDAPNYDVTMCVDKDEMEALYKKHHAE